MTTTTGSEIGKRSYQEDRWIVQQSGNELLIGVFDGHGGSGVSEFCHNHVVKYWDESHGTIIQRLRHTIKILHTNLYPFINGGSTASLVVIKDEKAYCAVIGDSPIITKDKYRRIKVSPEHNVRSNHKECLDAQKRGGFVSNGYLMQSMNGYGLQMTRAIGDMGLDRVLNRKPQTYTVELGDNSWVLVGSDGIFDPAHYNLDPADIVKNVEVGLNAQDIVDIAVNTPTYDNATAVLVRL